MRYLTPALPQSVDSTTSDPTLEVVEGVALADSLDASARVVATPRAVPPPAYLTVRGAVAQVDEANVGYTPPSMDSIVAQGAWPLTEEAQSLGMTSTAGYTIDLPGRVLDYSLRTDTWVSSTILLTFFLAAYTLARSWRFLRQQFKDFFYLRERANLFASAADNQFRGSFYLLSQFSLIVALIYFDYSTALHPELLLLASPYWLIGTGVLIVFAYALVKLWLYAWVGLTFFEHEQRVLWRKALTLSQLTESLLLFVLLLLLVYFNLSHEATLPAFGGIVGVVLVMRWYKLQTIFFGYRFGYVHGFLYFCTLEIMPFVGLWYALTHMHTLVATFF